jgi:uncharacterized protein (TIGR02453 family)
MAWFTEDTLAFYRDLEANNTREWFEANRKRYETSAKKPLEAFAAEMIGRMTELDPSITMLPKQAVSRIHRDTRFSKDKTPYKTSGYIVVSAGGKKAFATPGLYFNLGGDKMYIASGLYMLEPDQLAAVRRHLIAHPDELAARLADPDFQRLFGGIQGEANKILPAEFREAGAKLPLIFNKQFYYWKEYPATEALRDDLSDWVMEHMRGAWPMNQFLARALA